MTVLAKVAFAALVAATFGAFFVAQRLKATPPLVQETTADPFFSPNQDGRHERARIGLRLKRDDEVTVAVLDPSGEPIRHLVRSRPLEAGRPLRLKWDGRTDTGRRAPDAVYDVRVALRDQGRSVRLPRTIRLDTTPPRPRVLSIGPQAERRPELLPNRDGEPARIRFAAPGRRVEVDLVRTSPGRPRVVTRLLERPDGVSGGVGTVRWDGSVRGRRVAAGTFVVAVRSRDQAGNIGSSVPRPFVVRRGMQLAGRGGITVRYLGLQPPMVPVGAGRPATVFVDARGEPYRWALRRVGAPRPLRRGRRTRGGPLTIRMPDGEGGLYLLEARTRTHAARVPLAVDGRARRRVLVVLPAATWQGANPVDDDGDGLVDTLERGVAVRLARVLATPGGRGRPSGLPARVADNEAPLVIFLDRRRLRYDLTTDVALAAGVGPRLEGRPGVLLAGDTVWLQRSLWPRLRAFAERGGRVATLGTRSLLRQVRQTPRRLVEPTLPGSRDVFGARLGAIRRGPVDLSILEDRRLRLFAGGEGLFAGVRAFEPTLDAGPGERLAAAVGPDGRPVVVAARFGRGLLIRTGIVGFPSRLSSDPDSAELMRRTWTLLSR